MGSLMPGWGSTLPGVPPKGFEDYKDEAEDNYQTYTVKRQLHRLYSAPHPHTTSPSPVVSPKGRRSTDSSAAIDVKIDPRRKVARMLSRSWESGTGKDDEGSSSDEDWTENKDAATHSPQGQAKHHHQFRWWRHFDSAHMNEPFEEDRKSWATGSYVPQHGVAKMVDPRPLGTSCPQ